MKGQKWRGDPHQRVVRVGGCKIIVFRRLPFISWMMLGADVPSTLVKWFVVEGVSSQESGMETRSEVYFVPTYMYRVYFTGPLTKLRIFSVLDIATMMYVTSR